MLKQWLSHRSNHSTTDWSTAQTATPHRHNRRRWRHVTSSNGNHVKNHAPPQPQSFPLADKYLVSRVNPIYVDHEQHHQIHYLDLDQPDGSDSSGSDINDVTGHTSSHWSHLTCPQHGPQVVLGAPWTHHDAPQRHQYPNIANCPDVVPYHVSPSYYVLDPASPSPDQVTVSSQSVSSRHLHHHCHHHPHHLSCSGRNVVANYYEHPQTKMAVAAVPRIINQPHYHVIDSPSPETYPSVIPDSLEAHAGGSGSGETVSGSPMRSPYLHIYVNPDFVSGIAVRGNSRDRLRTLIGTHAADETVEGGNDVRANSRDRLRPFIVNSPAAELGFSAGSDSDSANAVNSGDADSLESLDEGMFAPSPPRPVPTDIRRTAAVTTSSTTTTTTVLVGSPDVVVNTVRVPAPYDTFSSAVSEVAAYDAIKDLYEKLSNNKQRQALALALSGSQRSQQSLKNYNNNTYETLTKGALGAGAYAKLTYGAVALTSGTATIESGTGSYLVPNGVAARLEAELRPPPETPPPVPGPSGRPVAVARVDGVAVPDTKYEVAPGPGNDQFMTRRDPNYGPQVTEGRNLIPARNQPQNIFQRINRRFRQKNYRDACKIIATTVVGLTAFGIITALSLGINRQPS